MKLKLLLLSLILSFSFYAFAQEKNKAFAITGNGNGDFQWMNIRQIDLSTGAVTKHIFENGKTKFSFLDAITKEPVKNISLTEDATAKLNNVAFVGKINNIQISPSPTQSLVAAAAYDKKQNKLFFAPLFINELRWLDLSSNSEDSKFYTLKSPLLNVGNAKDDANHFTRMTIGADGNGYALTNDGGNLIKFTTGKNVIITRVGALGDAATNKTISVHDKCNSWGGDIVADAFGDLYLFTASKNIFKIDLKTLIASHLGSITGLSGTFTLNGAAVDNDDNVIISSANSFEGFFKVSMKDLSATKLVTSGQIFNASDLANGNLLFESQARKNVGSASLGQPSVKRNQFLSIYPNPVFGTEFKLTFGNKAAGEYNITLADVQGKIIHNDKVYIKSAGQVETIQLKSKPANGVYFIKVFNATRKSVFSDKIVVE